jgi:hypothetical protein
MMMFGEQLHQYSEQLYLMQTIAFNAMNDKIFGSRAQQGMRRY